MSILKFVKLILYSVAFFLVAEVPVYAKSEVLSNNSKLSSYVIFNKTSDANDNIISMLNVITEYVKGGGVIFISRLSSQEEVVSTIKMLAEFGKKFNATESTEKVFDQLEDVSRVLNTEVITREYRYYEQDMPINNMVVSSVFARFLPNSFPRIKLFISEDIQGKAFIVQTEFGNNSFMSLADYGYKFNRNEDESDLDYKSRVRKLKEDYYDKISKVEELYVVTSFLGLPTPLSTEIGFSKNTGQAMLINAAYTYVPTFSQLDKFNDEDSCLISVPMKFKYQCDKKKTRKMLKTIASLNDNGIDRLVDRAYCEAGDYGYITTSSDERYKNRITKVLKKNRDVIVEFLTKDGNGGEK